MESKPGAIVYQLNGDSTRLVAVPHGKPIPKSIRMERWQAIYFLGGASTDMLPLALVSGAKASQVSQWYDLAKEAIKEGIAVERGTD